MADDDRDPPIEEPGFIGGVKVVNIGDVRVARGLTRRSSSSCPHKNMVYDQNERRIWCQDCERDVEPFDAFRNTMEQYSKAYDHLMRRLKGFGRRREVSGTLAGGKGARQGLAVARPHPMLPAMLRRPVPGRF